MGPSETRALHSTYMKEYSKEYKNRQDNKQKQKEYKKKCKKQRVKCPTCDKEMSQGSIYKHLKNLRKIQHKDS